MYIDICTHFPHIGRLRLQLIMGNMCDERRMGKEKLILHFILLCTFENILIGLLSIGLLYDILFFKKNISHLPKVTQPGKGTPRSSTQAV